MSAATIEIELFLYIQSKIGWVSIPSGEADSSNSKKGLRLDEINDLRARLKNGEQNLFAKFSARITHIERLRPIFGFVAVAGALVGALSRAASGEWGLGLTISGAIVASMCGAIVILMDYKKLEISQDAKDAHRLADDAINTLVLKSNELEISAARLENARKFDLKRLARIEATRLMIESLEAAYLTKANTKTSAQNLLIMAISALRKAVDYQAHDFLTFTIFQRINEADIEVMQYIARAWTDERAAAAGGRSWKPGDGYTGYLWSLARDNRNASLVEPDTQRPEAQQKYRVENADPELEKRYRSVASFPILIGRNNDIWGAVTATSDRAGVFDHTGDLARQSVETVRDIAMIASLLANLGTA